MIVLYDEICRRFPEVVADLMPGEEKEPYALMARLVEWLKRKQAVEITPEVIQRVQAFTRWCEDQPRGEIAADDLLTIVVVGFYEPLFKSAHLHRILPAIISKEDFIANATYLKDWVGQEKYDQASKNFR